MTNGLVFRCLVWLLFSGGVTGLAAEGDLLGPRVFTDVFGRAVVAEIVSLTGGEVGLKRSSDGSEFMLSLDRLSDADQAFLADNREQIAARVTPRPETAFTEAARRDFRVLKKNGLALEPVPLRMWTTTRYFLIVYGIPDSAETTMGIIKVTGEQITRRLAGNPVSVLWLGPSNRNSEGPPPVPGSDLKTAKVLPSGVAVIGVDAVARDGARVDAEIEAIARDESPGDPRLFFESYVQRPEAVRAGWRRRIMARVAPYWPGCVYRTNFDRRKADGATQAFLVDREGRPVIVNGQPLEGFVGDVIGYAEKLLAAGP